MALSQSCRAANTCVLSIYFGFCSSQEVNYVLAFDWRNTWHKIAVHNQQFEADWFVWNVFRVKVVTSPAATLTCVFSSLFLFFSLPFLPNYIHTVAENKMSNVKHTRIHLTHSRTFQLSRGIFIGLNKVCLKLPSTRNLTDTFKQLQFGIICFFFVLCCALWTWKKN